MDKINQWIASELGVGLPQVSAAVELLGEGASVPFIARYRKERTGGLDDTQSGFGGPPGPPVTRGLDIVHAFIVLCLH